MCPERTNGGCAVPGATSQAPTKYPHVLKAVFDTPWAITPEMLGIIAEVARFRAEGGVFTEDEIQQRIAAQTRGPRRGAQQGGSVAVIPIYGVLSQRLNLMSALSGGTSVEQLTSQFRSALADPDVAAIVFDIDSPGGAVDGIEEFATEIREARGQKPISAVANTMAASAAYWLASQADEVIVTPSGSVGSIGILAVHQDFSQANEKAGVKTTVITAGKYKAEGHEDLPLSDEAVAYVQGQADEFYAMFVGAVAEGRGVSEEKVRGADFGEGRMLLARAAKASGMVDRIETLDAVIARLAARPARRAATSAEAPALPFSQRLALVADEAAELVAHASERARLRAKEGRPGVSDTNREQLSALSASLGSIQSDITAVLDTVEPEEVAADPDQPDAPPSAKRIGLAVYEAAMAGGYRLPDEVPTQ
jgi:signal peptide peptidase SppA